LLDTFISNTSISPITRRAGIKAVEAHRAEMTHFRAQYPYPDSTAVKIWAEIRGIEVKIPAYEDAKMKYAEQLLGPDELLVFATAAAVQKPLVGPSPSDPELLAYLEGLGIRFTSPVLVPIAS